jgi:glycosyltransferase involved in cell wall biosynthesis
MLAPPWIPVPPPAYGGIEAVVALLCEALVERGVSVTLFAAPGSHSPAAVCAVLPYAHPDEIESSLHESDHVASAFRAIDEAEPRFDVIHDHCGFTAFAMADRVGVPLIHTMHGPFTAATADFYRRHSSKARVVAISQTQRAAAPIELRVAGVVSNPIDGAAWPYTESKLDYLLWVGRMHPDKGPHRAIVAARDAGVALVLAGPVQPGQERFFAAEVEPHLDGDAVRYVGNVGGERRRCLFATARALLMPIRWPEPFGLVMVEALACGTPVIAFREGAAREIVRHGYTGFLVEDERAMAAAVSRLATIEPAACRADAIKRFDKNQVAAKYEAVYARVARTAPASRSLRRRRATPVAGPAAVRLR